MIPLLLTTFACTYGLADSVEETATPCLSPSATSLRFAFETEADASSRDLGVLNCGDVPVRLLGAGIEGGDGRFWVEDPAALEGVELAPGARATVAVAHAPRGLEGASGTLQVWAEDPSLDQAIPLTAERWDSVCEEDLITEPNGAWGAVAAADPRTVYVAGDPNRGGAWQLAELDLVAASLTPVIQREAMWMWADRIRLTDRQVEVWEFYPSSMIHAFHRDTREVTSRPDDNLWESVTYTHVWRDRVYEVRVGVGVDDPCGNVCVVALDPDGGPAAEVLDDSDADVPWYLHTGSVAFIEDSLYFLAYPKQGGEGASWRRLRLASGSDEALFHFEPGQVNTWVSEPVQAADGAIYWLRNAQDDIGGPAEVTIDRYAPETGATQLDFSGPLGSDARHLSIHEDRRLLWTDSIGLRTVSLPSGGAPQTLVERAIPEEQLNYDALGDRVWHTRSVGPQLGGDARLGCARLPE